MHVSHLAFFFLTVRDLKRILVLNLDFWNSEKAGFYF